MGKNLTRKIKFQLLGIGILTTFLVLSGCGGTSSDNTSSGNNQGGGSVYTTQNITITPSSCDFGRITVGSSDTKIITISNTGSSDLLITSVTTGSTEYVVDLNSGSNPLGALPATIPPNQSRTIQVSFSPDIPGSYQSDLKIVSNDPDTPEFSIPLHGESVQAPVPNISVYPSSHDFGDVTVDSYGVPVEITISNVGSADLSISDISSSDPFVFPLDLNGGSSPCGTTSPILSPGGSCTLEATFYPTATGSFSGTIDITSSDPDTQITTVFLTGNGTSSPPPTFSVTLSWDPPTTNTDGTPLTDLAGYRVYYGNSPGSYSYSIDVGNVTTFTLSNLTSGTYYFAVTAYNSSGIESGFSNEVSKTF